MKYSINKKLDAVLNCIESDITNAFCDYTDGKENAGEIIANLEWHKQQYPGEIDYNIAQNGNMLCYYSQVYKLYRNCGYKITEKFSSEKIWQTYCRQVGYVCREILQRKSEFLSQFRNA